MQDLVQWLGVQLDEDERIARAATPGPWRYDPDKHWRRPGTSWFEEGVFAGPAGKEAICVAGTGETDDPPSMADAAHIAKHDPAQMLQEIDAKRQLLEKCRAGLHRQKVGGVDGAWSEGFDEGLLEAVKLIALAYADRLDYQDSWRP